LNGALQDQRNGGPGGGSVKADSHLMGQDKRKKYLGGGMGRQRRDAPSLRSEATTRSGKEDRGKGEKAAEFRVPTVP